MPGKSKGSSTPTKRPAPASKTTVAAKAARRPISRDPDHPFAADVLDQSQAIVADYQIILTSEDGEWYGRGLELPNVFGDGATPAKCIDSTREALTAAVAYLLEQGQTPPAPAKQGKRTTQVNVRLTAEEKAILEGTARRKGFEGLSDYLRAAALEAVH
jgi:predicted RNase H-like HicB family nuclease